MSAATSALSTVALMGYSLTIPDWFYFIFLFSLAMSGLIGLVKFIYSFIFSADADDK